MRSLLLTSPLQVPRASFSDILNLSDISQTGTNPVVFLCQYFFAFYLIYVLAEQTSDNYTP